jgi:hypothetical protein
VKGEKREDDLNTSESNVRMRGEWISEGLCGRERERERWGMTKRYTMLCLVARFLVMYKP